MEKVLVTGANGLLGYSIVKALLEQNYQVRAMIRHGAFLESLKLLSCEIVYGEISSENDVESAIEGCDYVIHCAARTAQNPPQLEAFREANIDATRHLIHFSKIFSIRRFVFVSSANCFTNGSKSQPGTENSGFMPWLKKSGYAYSKYLAQEMVLNEVSNNNFPALVISPTFMIGPNDSKPSSGQLLLHGINKRVVFYPSGGKSFVDVNYAAEAAVSSLKKGKIGEAYLLAGTNLTYREFFKELHRFSPKKHILIPIPSAILFLAGGLSEVFTKIFSKPLPLSLTNARLLSLDNYFSNKKAIQELGLKNTDITLSISKALHWFKTNGYV